MSPLTTKAQSLKFKSKKNGKEELRKAQTKKISKSTLPQKLTPPNTLIASSPPLAMNSSNTNRGNNEMLCMRIKIRVLHKTYKQVFKQLCTINMPRLTKQE
jgi:hypothetical protein